MGALDGIRICDLSGQLAGAGATRTLAAFGAQVIRIEDPSNQGRWDVVRGTEPFRDERRGIELGGGFNNHNVDKLGITLDLRTERGKELLADLVRISDVVTENFSAGVLERLGFGHERLRELRPDIIYVSNCGFGHTGPYSGFRTWGGIVQAVSGLTFLSGRPDHPSAGWGFSYMDHQGANFMVVAILAALLHRNRTGEGQWVDMSCVESAMTLLGPTVLDWSVNGRPNRRDGMPDSNHGMHPSAAPHCIYPASGDDAWVAIACPGDVEWAALAATIGQPWTSDERWSTVAGRIAGQDELDDLVAAWTSTREKFAIEATLREAGVPAAAVQRPVERIDHDPTTAAWGLWPEVEHPEIGRVRVDGIPVHLSATDWSIERAAPTLGQHNDDVLGELLGLGPEELAELRRTCVI